MLASSALASPVASARAFRRRLCIANATPLPSQYKSLTPVGDRVFVQVDKQEARTVGGVLLPAAAKKKPTAGTVVTIGNSHVVKLGDHVVYSKYAGTEVSIGGADHVLLKEDDVIGTLPPSNKISEMKPLQDRILIKNSKAADRTAGGVLLASDTSERPTFGEVVAVGEGRKKEDSDEMIRPNVQPGQTVLYSKYSGTEFEEDDLDFVVVRESDILAALS